MSNLGPYPRRMWVNQPSKDQPLHNRHGENVLAIPDFGGGAHRAYTLNPDDATSFYAPEGTLSDGWQAAAQAHELRRQGYDYSLAPLYTAPPRPEASAPVGVEVWLRPVVTQGECVAKWGFCNPDEPGATPFYSNALAQQPAAVDGAMVERVTNAVVGWATLPGDLPAEPEKVAELREVISTALVGQQQGGTPE